MKLRLGFFFANLVILSAVAQSGPSNPNKPESEARYDLNGEWQGQFFAGEPLRMVIEKVMVQQIDDQIIATKITGDEYVPAGKITMRGAYKENPFSVEQVCALPGYVNPTWHQETVTVIDNRHLVVRGEGCRDDIGETKWERPGKVTIALDNAVLFDFDKYQLKPEASALLAKIKEQLNKTHPNARLLIAGYTDDIGTVSHNLQLSRRRAWSVARWLQTHGIAKPLLEIKGFGKKNPRYPNINEEARSRNRRVEIVVL